MILLTGVGGFVGRTIRRAFRRYLPEESLLGVSRRSIIPPEGAPDGLRLVQCDLRDPAQVARLPFDRITGLIHVAAAVPGSDGDYFEDNVRATSNLLAALDGAPLKSIVLISSLSVYDWRTPRPQPMVLTEDAPFPAVDEYGRSKLLQEWLIRAFAGSRLGVCIFRPSSIYGPGMPPRSVLPRWLLTALRGERLKLTAPRGYRQNFVYAEDVAALVCRACSEGARGIFNLFSHDTLELPALAETVRRLTGNGYPVEDAQQDAPCARLVFDNSRLLAAFQPAFTPLEEGLRSTIDWMRGDGAATSDRGP